MAKHLPKVYLGYEGEVVEKNHTHLDYTVNKIGGLPNWPQLKSIKFSSKCPLCNLHRLLIVQCYVPIENSVYHRTLYVFACINPNCWTESESWTCVRSQIQDDPKTMETVVALPNAETNLSWCKDCDEWDENDNGDTSNGNITIVYNCHSPNKAMQRASDEEDESNSLDMETVEQAFGNLQVYDAHNANMSPVQGAVGAIGVPTPVAELEGGDEPDLVLVDTPTRPTNNIEALLNQAAELPPDIRSRLISTPLQFVPKYLYVEEEWHGTLNDDVKVTELLNKYKKDNEIENGTVVDGIAGGASEDETYEEALPLHGDRLFHTFLTRLHDNPGQILRYTRDGGPLLGAPILSRDVYPESTSSPTICKRCGASATCELQLVPAFTNTLRILPHNISIPHLQFLSVLIFTCSRSCWHPNDTLVEETVVFQPEVI